LTSPRLLKEEKILRKFFSNSPGRLPLWHVKDLSKDFQKNEPVGNGSIDFKRIFAKASTAGMKHFFVEHDMPQTNWKELR
jgi:sugar phosphate isomerase/epimerase